MSSTYRAGLRRLADKLRALSGPNGYDIRTNQLTIRTRVWSGRVGKLPIVSTTDLVLPAQYPIRNFTSQELRDDGGEFEVGDIVVDHITPFDGISVGYTPEQLKPEADDATEIIYLITGEHQGQYKLLNIRTFRPFTYQLILRRTVAVPSV